MKMRAQALSRAKSPSETPIMQAINDGLYKAEFIRNLAILAALEDRPPLNPQPSTTNQQPAAKHTTNRHATRKEWSR